MKVKSESEVAQSCLTFRDPMDCGPPGSSVHGIFQARVLEWGAIAFSEDAFYWVLISWHLPEVQAEYLTTPSEKKAWTQKWRYWLLEDGCSILKP